METIMNKYEQIMSGRYGQRYMEYREAYKSKDIDNDLVFPLEIDFDLIDTCNLQCKTCHSIGRHRSHKSMNKEFIHQMLQECNEYNMPAINIGGCGEPLINMELTNYALSELKNTSVMDIFIHTNGILLNEENSYYLIDGGVTFLCISIDAASQNIYRTMKGANLNIIVENIERFLALRKNELPFLRISFLATSINIHEKDTFMNFWKDKVDMIDIQNYIRIYDIQPKVNLAKEIIHNNPMPYQIKKRMAIVAPEFLCASCGGRAVEDAIIQDNTYSKFRTIKNYWDNYILREI